MDPVDEEQMIALCRQGDLTGFRLVYDRYNRPLLRVATRVLGRLQDAEDAVQETFLKLFKGIGGFRSGSCFSTYLFQILNNTCIDAIRKRKPAGAEITADTDPTILGRPETHELGHSLAEAISSLPAQMRASFILNAVEEFTQEEAAEILGTSVGAVKTQVHRARKRLRAWLAARPEGERP